MHFAAWLRILGARRPLAAPTRRDAHGNGHVDPAIVPVPGLSGAAVTRMLQHGDPTGSVWRPGETDVSIRPGWFHHPAEDARVNSMSFELQSPYQGAVVSVTSSNGWKSWDTIQRGAKISFNAVMQVDTAYPGYVERVGIWLGKCTNTECAI